MPEPQNPDSNSEAKDKVDNPSGSEGNGPNGNTDKAQQTYVLDWIKKCWEKFEEAIGRRAAACIGAVLVLGALYQVIGPHLYVPHRWPKEPLVIHISPDKEFGRLRYDGFKHGFDSARQYTSIVVEPLTGDFDKMKLGDISDFETRLAELLSSNRVVAVVGPSITESTRPVIDLVRKHGNSRIPILLESSIPPTDVGWHEGTGDLFRLSSGADRRGLEIGSVARELVHSGLMVAFVVEKPQGSYGQALDFYASKSLGDANSQVRRFKYTPKEMGALLASEEGNELAELAKHPDGRLFHLGVGGDLRPLLEAHFRPSEQPGKGRIVGVMSAYMTGPRLASGTLSPSRVFEVTDVDFVARLSPTEQGTSFLQRFGLETLEVPPDKRDEAFSYDEGVLVGESLVKGGNGWFYYSGLDDLRRRIADAEAEGVASRIRLQKKHTPGQNIGSPLRLAYWDAQRNWWAASTASALKYK